MSKLAELQKRKNELFSTIESTRNAFNERKAAGKTGADLWPADERAKWDQVNKDHDKILEQIEEERNAESVEEAYKRAQEAQRERSQRDGSPFRGGDSYSRIGDDGASTGTDSIEEARAFALQAWMRSAAGMPLTKKHQEAARRCGVNLKSKRCDLSMSRTGEFRAKQAMVRNLPQGAESRVLSAVTGASGAFTIPQGFVPSLETAMLSYDAVEQAADVMITDSGNAMPWPTVNDTSNEGVLLAENTTIGASVDPVYAQTTFNAYKYSSKPVMIPYELLEDSAFDMASEIGQLLGQRLGRISAKQFTTGTGSSQPQGVVTGAAAGLTAASATAIAADEIIRLYYALDPVYQPNAAYMMHNNIMSSIRLLKDTTNQYLWQPSFQLGQPDLLNGRRVYLNQYMQATIATTTKTVLCGDFSKYKIRRCRNVRLVRMNERYADLDQVAFIAFVRQDGKVLDSGSNPIKVLTQL